MNDRGSSGSASGWAALGLLALACAIAIGRTRPSSPRGLDAAEHEFSAARALERLRRVLRDETPHPVGSEANARVRERIVAELEGLGLEPTIEESFCAGRSGVLAVVRNVVASVPGIAGGPGVLLSCHYDSVAAGPGAADDGSGVASLLEIARALAAEPPARTVALLFTDGEEAGLIGAEAFAARHELAEEFSSVVNLEARGTDGPCHLFETNRGNSELVRLYAGSVDRPSASSVMYEVYERLPNDTDLTVYKRAGLAAANFAFIGGLRRYHTGQDDLAHLSPASVQHQGEQALALVRALALHPPGPPGAAGDSIYADVLGLVLVRWPESLAIPLALAAAAGLALAARREVRRRSSSVPAILRGGALVAATIAAATLVAAAVVHGIESALDLDDPSAADPLPATAAFVAASVATAALLARASFFSRAGFEGAWLGTWLLLAAAGIAAAAIVPGTSVLLLPPCLAAAAVGFARPPLLRAAFPLVLLALLWVPLALGLGTTAELSAPMLLGAPVGVILAATTPALALVGARGLARLAAAAGGVAGLSAVLALFAAGPPPDRPAWLNLVHLEDADAGTARVFANTFGARLPVALRERADFSLEPENPLPGARLGFQGYSASVEGPPSPAPSVERIAEEAEGGVRTIRVRVASTRGARGLVLVARTGAEPGGEHGIASVAWNGHEIARPRPVGGSGETWTLLGTGSEGVDLVLRARADARVELWVLDMASGLPASVEGIARARPAGCVPRGGGDVSFVLRRVEL